MPLCKGQIPRFVPEDELVVAEVFVEPAPVPTDDVALHVVLRPDVRDLVVGALPKVGSFSAGVDACGHASAARRSAAWSRAAAGPGRQSPTAFPSSSITGITSRIEDDVNASSAPASRSTGNEPSLTP
jgi:hypothetical protein